MSAQWSMTAHVRESPAGAALHALWAVIHLHCLLQRPAWWRVSANIRCCLVGIKNQSREALTSGGPAGCGGNTLQPTATQWGGLENWKRYQFVLKITARSLLQLMQMLDSLKEQPVYFWCVQRRSGLQQRWRQLNLNRRLAVKLQTGGSIQEKEGERRGRCGEKWDEHSVSEKGKRRKTREGVKRNEGKEMRNVGKNNLHQVNEEKRKKELRENKEEGSSENVSQRRTRRTLKRTELIFVVQFVFGSIISWRSDDCSHGADCV